MQVNIKDRLKEQLIDDEMDLRSNEAKVQKDVPEKKEESIAAPKSKTKKKPALKLGDITHNLAIIEKMYADKPGKKRVSFDVPMGMWTAWQTMYLTNNPTNTSREKFLANMFFEYLFKNGELKKFIEE